MSRILGCLLALAGAGARGRLRRYFIQSGRCLLAADRLNFEQERMTRKEIDSC